MANECIKVYAIKKGVKMVQIANEMNIFRSNLSRMLKLELSNEKKLEIIGIIDEISNGNAKFENVLRGFVRMMNEEQKKKLMFYAEQILLKEREE